MSSGIGMNKKKFMFERSMCLKSGVSLIVVLLFMLIATIAATATYKWITSESRSSGARMIQREAFQSAEAGIEATRAWMTHHGNDVGALIKKYIDGGNHPIKIDGQMAEFKRGGQSYDVWLTGVNTESSPYKLKILSKGKSRNGVASYTEAAILKVDGLYRVTIPAKKTTSNFFFNYNYFGGSMENHGNMNSTSILVNGDWYGNPNTVSTVFVVTGNAELTGNNLHIGETACIGGNLSANNGFTGRDLYVEKDAKSFTARLQGNVYFNGSVEMGSQADPGFNVDSNVYLKGTMVTNQGALSPVIHGNFCLDENALLLSSGNNHDFVVKQSVWMPGPFNVAFGEVSDGQYVVNDNSGIDSRYGRIVFAESSGTAYIKYGKESEHYSALHNKSFKEDKKNAKTCDKVTANYYQAVCAQLEGFGFTWADQWSYWEDDNTYHPYAWERTAATDKYYIYYTEPGPGKKDVEFKKYNRKDLRQVRTGHAAGPGPMGMQPFKDSEMGAYYVGGEYFYYQDLVTTGGGWMAPISYSLTPHYRGYHFDCLHNDKNNSCEDGSIVGSPYCKKISTEGFRPFCSVPSWFSVKGSFSATDPTDLDCGESIKTTCDSIWHKGGGCFGADYKVDDMLKNSYDVFKEYATKGCAANIKEWTDDIVDKLNNCYAQQSTDNLFNGYLVVSIRSTGMKNPSGTLTHKYIIVFENDPGQNAFPPTAKDAYVFLYLRQGASSSLQPKDPGTYNYFIFTDKDVANFLFNNDAVLSGSIYAKAENCARVKDMTINKMEMNQDLINDLVMNGVLCPYENTDCGEKLTTLGSSSSATSETSVSTEVFGGSDAYYIASAPQLRISVESQYKNAESESALANAQNLGGSFIVLPRVVYISKDPKGSLDDYYGAVPLNSKSPVTNKTVTCTGGIPTTGKLYTTETGYLSEGYFTCTVKAKVDDVESQVPFYVVVKGTLSGTPEANFELTSVELAKNATTTPTIVLDGQSSEQYVVKVSIPTNYDENAWEITEYDASTTCSNGFCTVTIPSGTTSKEILNVKNKNASSGGINLTIVDCEGCRPGLKRLESIYVAASANVELKSLHDYCATYPDECPEGSVLKRQANTAEWPDCPEIGTWVNVSANGGDGCRTLTANHDWVCDIASNISLTQGTVPSGCQVVIPSEYNSYSAQLTPNGLYYMYAGLKASTLTFKTGFGGDAVGSQQTVHVDVVDNNGNTREMDCSYASFSANHDNCAIDVYRGSKVTLSLPGSPSDFNRWKCESGSDCEGLSNLNQRIVSFYVSEDDVVYAHFNEKDKHCFFDEFRQQGLSCTSQNSTSTDEKVTSEYCITPCTSTNHVCKNNAKWLLVEGSLDDLQLDTYDKKIKLKESVTRHKKESQMPKVTILSSVEAGLYGTLKAQFKISKMSSSNKNIAKAAIKNTGFILRSAADTSSYLMLNLYLDDNNSITARLCLNGSDVCMESALYNGFATAYANDGAVVLASATIKGIDGNGDTLVVSAIPSTFSTTTYSTSFALNNTKMPGVENLKVYGTNETVGFRLGDPNFELYGIGWYSEDNNAECWDTYPTIKCSFKANYAGGIVPKGTAVYPWVGLSAWFDQGYGQCEQHYYYNGNNNEDLVCTGSALADDGTFFDCGERYTFGMEGSHGSDRRIAKAGVSDCGLTYDDKPWASVNAECGPFWVGDFTPCTRTYEFKYVDGSSSGEYWNVDGADLANLRDATLKINLNNPSLDTVEISMFSQYENDAYSYGSDAKYSQTFRTNATGDISIDVSSLSDAEGFNPEKVMGVYIHNLTSGARATMVSSVMTSCPNVLSVGRCYASYNMATNEWKIQAVVNNADRAGEIQVSVNSNEVYTDNMNPSSLSCGASGGESCSWGDASGKAKTVLFDWKDNPYVKNTGKNYVFTVSLMENGSATSTCITDPYPISSISATCRLLKNSAVVGRGIPVVEYTLGGCPDNRCGYEVYVEETGVVIAQDDATGDFTGLNSSPFALNSSTSPLPKGTYTVKMRQKNASRPFAEVECNPGSFTVVDENQQQSEIQATCSFDNTSLGFGQSTTFRSSQFTGTHQNASIKLVDGDGNEVSSNGTFWTGGNYDVWVKPTKAGEMTYKLIVNGGVSCEATLTVAEPEAVSCSITGDLYQGQQLSVNVPNLNIDGSDKLTWTIGETSKTIDCNSGGCWNNTMTAPAVAGSYAYSVVYQGFSICSGTLNIGSALTCSVTPTELNKKASYTFTATKNINCSNCSFTDASNSISSVYFPENENELQVIGKAMASGEKTLSIACACDNNFSGTCSKTITVADAEEPFTCPTDANPTTWECETNNGFGSVNGFGKNAKCVKILASKVTVQSSNAEGRSFCVNGEEAELNDAETNLLQKEYSAGDDGYVTLCVSAGNNESAQLEWFNCKLPAQTISFDCDDDNSTNMTGSNFVMTAGQCYKRTCSNSANWHLTGPIGAKMLYKDCSGNVQSHTFVSDWQWWPSFDLGNCTAYFKMDQNGQSDNCWQ
ncbi:pilus assembly PilX N-terminal domain-containing protein [Fibrobacter sp. UWB5]|uniref:pilus assembly PilX N-terminal domain-containing protein n=1 Tax=Fibrobacter sp. UWB5 TaxID=1964360 RepID=UPI000B523A86|nr:pilus assembly PilX N-terminal domain-containing protein [Fibrobacter sp. UWB5]OWV12205.1 hypothetical protein B7989_07690 [Fibrobacter sp. UWB5]